MKLTDMKPTERRLSLFTGEPGTGKSWQAASYAKVGSTKIIDLDQRANSLVRLAKDYPDIAKNIDIDSLGPGDFLGLKEILDGLQMRCPFDVVIVDGLTATSRVIMNYMMSIRGGGKRSDAPGATGYKKKGVLDLPEIEDFGGEARGLNIVVDTLRSLPVKHAILTAHLIITESVDLVSKKKTTSRSLLTGGKKVAAELPAYFDEVYHFRVEPNANQSMPPDFMVYTTHTGDDFAKTALPLPRSINVTGKLLFPIIEKAIVELSK